MRRFAITLTVLGAATFSQAMNADDAPKRSAELQVLDRFVGTWNVQVTAKPSRQKAVTRDGVEIRKWSRGGSFVLIENPAPPELHMALTYDAKAKEYTGFLMSGTSRALFTGTWDERKQTMSFKATSPDGTKYVGTTRFIDKDHAESSGTVSTAEGKVVVEIFQKQTRRER